MENLFSHLKAEYFNLYSFQKNEKRMLLKIYTFFAITKKIKQPKSLSVQDSGYKGTIKCCILYRGQNLTLQGNIKHTNI